MNKLDEPEFLAEIRSRLDRSTADLNPAMTVRLDQMREQALNTPRIQQVVDDESLVDGVLNTLDDNEELSPVIEQRLDQIRQKALAKMGASNTVARASLLDRIREDIAERFSSGISMPASMFATACLMVTVVSLFYVSSRPAGSLSLEEELTLIASADDIELYENLDFYLWLAENGLPD
ncbi:MAG: hypothetical protein GKR91_14445 [Pseudomonadales bacterium]|nr:hypothetical protein [Pseudomonadales bacterium]